MQVQTRLTALRDRELSSIEARHVVATAESTLVEKADVSGIWEWWRNGREELQRDMMADVMRKRRRVDREKRAVEGGRRASFYTFLPIPSGALHWRLMFVRLFSRQRSVLFRSPRLVRRGR